MRLATASSLGFAVVFGPSQACGTPFYLSPEKARGERYGRAADMWSLGVVAHELLTFKRPYPSHSMRELLRKLVLGETDSTAITDCPHNPQLAVLASSMFLLAPDPSERMKAVDLVEFLQDLAATSGGVRHGGGAGLVVEGGGAEGGGDGGEGGDGGCAGGDGSSDRDGGGEFTVTVAQCEAGGHPACRATVAPLVTFWEKAVQAASGAGGACGALSCSGSTVAKRKDRAQQEAEMLEAANRAVDMVEAASQKWSVGEEAPPPHATLAVAAADNLVRTVGEVNVEVALEQDSGSSGSYPSSLMTL